MRKTPGLRGAWTARVNTRSVVFVAAIAGFAATGLIFLNESDAAVHTAGIEAETGTVSGRADAESAEGASDGMTVRFGVVGDTPTPAPPPPPPTPPSPTPPPPPPPPTVPNGLRTYVGGDSIAVTWYPSELGEEWVTKYNVYRNNVKVATTVADTNESATRLGTVYIDRNVSRGSTYTYQVEAVSSAGALSARTSSVSATHPNSSLPVPNVIVDGSINQHASSTRAWFDKYAVPAVKTWYPKIAHQLAYPDYTPPGTITIKTLSQESYDKQYPGTWGIHWPGASDVFINPGHLRDQPAEAVATIIHESVHMLQHYDYGKPSPPNWFTEGLANYAENSIYPGFPYYMGQESPPGADEHYTDKYWAASRFMYWLQKKYDGSYMRRMNVAGGKKAVTSALTAFSDGRNFDQAWALWRNKSTRTGEFKQSSSGKCLDNSNSNMIGGNRIVLWDCNGSLAQRITYRPIPGTSAGMLIVQGYCISVANNERIREYPVWIYHCGAGELGQHWVKRSDGSFMNPHSNFCLVPAFGGTGNGTNIIVDNCNGSSSQRWNAP